MGVLKEKTPRPDVATALAGNPGPWILAGAALASAASHAIIAAALARGKTFAQAFREAQEDRFQRALAVARAQGEPAAAATVAVEESRATREARAEQLQVSLAARREAFEAELQERRLAVERELAQFSGPPVVSPEPARDVVTEAEVAAAHRRIIDEFLARGRGNWSRIHFSAANIAKVLNGELPWPGRGDGYEGAAGWVETAGGPARLRDLIRGGGGAAVPGGDHTAVQPDPSVRFQPGPGKVCVPVGTAISRIPGLAGRLGRFSGAEVCVGPGDELFQEFRAAVDLVRAPASPPGSRAGFFFPDVVEGVGRFVLEGIQEFAEVGGRFGVGLAMRGEIEAIEAGNYELTSSVNVLLNFPHLAERNRLLAIFRPHSRRPTKTEMRERLRTHGWTMKAVGSLPSLLVDGRDPELIFVTFTESGTDRWRLNRITAVR